MTASSPATVLPRVLAVCSFIPYPARRGDPVRVLGLLQALDRAVDLHVICLDDGGDLAGLREQLPGAVVEAMGGARTRRLGPASDVLRLVESLVAGTPSWVLKLESRQLSRAVRARSKDMDRVLAFGEAAAQYARHIDRSWHWDKFNVQTVSVAAEHAHLPRGAHRLKVWIDLVATRRYERRFSRLAASVSVTNSAEGRRFADTFGRSASVLHSTVPVPADAARSPERGRLLWLGNLSYRSNREGLIRFLAEGWPLLADRYTLRVVGSDMSVADRLELSRHRSVQAVGFVDDLDPELRSAQLGVVPLWSGGGTKMKTLTMMAAGLPVISTAAGAEGIPIEADAIVVADTPTALARAIADAGPEAEELGSRGRAVVTELYSQAGSEFVEQMRDLVATIGRGVISSGSTATTGARS